MLSRQNSEYGSTMQEGTVPQGPATFAHYEALVSPDWLVSRLSDPKIRIVDGRFGLVTAEDGSVRPHPKLDAYQEGHIPGAVFLDVMTDLSASDEPTSVIGANEFESLMARFGINNDTMVVIYDDEGGTWAARLWWALRYYGHDRVAMLDGGFPNWSAQEYETESGVCEVPTGVFRCSVRPELRVTADEVEAAIGDNSTCIVDALPHAFYTGEMSLYPSHRSGHIPGAKNVPAPANIESQTGRMLSPDDLRRLWEPVGIHPDQRVITYCGGGVYASFALFALHLLGHENFALYDASWSEWGTDTRRPVESGSE